MKKKLRIEQIPYRHWGIFITKTQTKQGYYSYNTATADHALGKRVVDLSKPLLSIFSVFGERLTILHFQLVFYRVPDVAKTMKRTGL